MLAVLIKGIDGSSAERKANRWKAVDERRVKARAKEETEVADAQASETLIGHSGLFFTLPGLLTVKPPVRTQFRKSPVGTQHLLWASKLC